jgi:hypothetical protein
LCKIGVPPIINKEIKMANKVQILDKIERNCKQRGIATSRTTAESLVAGNFTVTYVDADIQAPMGGINDQASPFLGIGVANPGVINMNRGAALSALTAEDLRVIRIVSGHANDITISNGASELARLEGHVDLLGMGQ